MELKLIIALVVVALFGSSFAEDYCQLCSDHVGCDNPGTPADICDQIIDIDDELKNIFVDTHNQLRNTVAGGDIEHLEPAVRMPTVQWDEGVAKTAWYNVISCNYGHDSCRITDQFDNVGQNIAMSMTSGSDVQFEDPKEIAGGMVEGWYSEYKDTNMSIINKLTTIVADNGNQIGHFTQLAYDRVIRIGCAMSQFKTPNEDNADEPWLSSYLVCNYAGSQISDFPVYKAGPATSSCDGTNPDYPNLCNPDQVVSISPFADDY